jgi:hypothetical protein
MRRGEAQTSQDLSALCRLAGEQAESWQAGGSRARASFASPSRRRLSWKVGLTASSLVLTLAVLAAQFRGESASASPQVPAAAAAQPQAARLEPAYTACDAPACQPDARSQVAAPSAAIPGAVRTPPSTGITEAVVPIPAQAEDPSESQSIKELNESQPGGSC